MRMGNPSPRGHRLWRLHHNFGPFAPLPCQLSASSDLYLLPVPQIGCANIEDVCTYVRMDTKTNYPHPDSFGKRSTELHKNPLSLPLLRDVDEEWPWPILPCENFVPLVMPSNRRYACAYPSMRPYPGPIIATVLLQRLCCSKRLQNL